MAWLLLGGPASALAFLATSGVGLAWLGFGSVGFAVLLIAYEVARAWRAKRRARAMNVDTEEISDS